METDISREKASDIYTLLVRLWCDQNGVEADEIKIRFKDGK